MKTSLQPAIPFDTPRNLISLGETFCILELIGRDKGFSMPLVFVHGVNVRRDEEYDRGVERRDSLFRRFMLRQLVPNWDRFPILNPYWGDVAARFAWNHASLPVARDEMLGGSDEVVRLQLAELGVFSSNPEAVVLETARNVGMEAAVDLLWATASRATCLLRTLSPHHSFVTIQ